MPSPDTSTEHDPIDGADLLGHLDPMRDEGDIEIDIPLHALAPAPWNPKPKIHGIYRRGLVGSLGTFALRDRLKVWPNPRQRGHYIALDGNQRLDTIPEMIEDHRCSVEAFRRLANEMATETVDVDGQPIPVVFNPAEKAHQKRLKAMFETVKADEAFLAGVRSEAGSTLIPCRVLAALDPDDAKLFTLAFDRNRAKFDEEKVTKLAEEIEANKAHLGERQAAFRKQLEAIVRPERPINPPAAVALPPPPPKTPAASSAAPAPAVDADGDDQPWGPPPAVPDADRPSDAATPWQSGPLGAAPTGPKPQLVPVMFSLTPAGHRKLQDGILRSTARPIREAKLTEAMERLLAADPEADLSDAYVEIALLCLNDRIAIARANADPEPNTDTEE